MTKLQAAKYLGITPAAFDYRCKKLGLEPSGTYKGKNGTGYLYDLATVIAIGQYESHQIKDGKLEQSSGQAISE